VAQQCGLAELERHKRLMEVGRETVQSVASGWLRRAPVPAVVEGNHPVARCELLHERDELLSSLRPPGQADDRRPVTHFAVRHRDVAIDRDRPSTHAEMLGGLASRRSPP
jgi:hypothetical protein